MEFLYLMVVIQINTEKADVGRSGILDAAAKLFRQQGYAAVSLRAIAASAGIKAASIYYHFASKDVIVAEILDAGILAVQDEVRNSLEALPMDASPAEILRAGIRGHLRALLEHGDYTSANVRIFGQVPEAVREANLPVRREYEAFWDELLTGLQAKNALRDNVNIATFRLSLIGALNATLEWFDPQKGAIDALADHYANIFLHGILQIKGVSE